MYTFNWIMCGVSLVGLAMHLFFFARIVTDSRIREMRHRLIALMQHLCYLVSTGLLFLAVCIPLRHHSGDIDEKFLISALLLMFLPNVYDWVKRKTSADNRLKSTRTPDIKQ